MSTVTQKPWKRLYLYASGIACQGFSDWWLITLKSEHVESCPVLVIFAYQAQGRIS